MLEKPKGEAGKVGHPNGLRPQDPTATHSSEGQRERYVRAVPQRAVWPSHQV